MNMKKAGVGVVVPLLVFAAAVPLHKQSEIEPRQQQQEETLTKPIMLSTGTDTTTANNQSDRKSPQYV